jgi:excisionase family DNA binding protein
MANHWPNSVPYSTETGDFAGKFSRDERLLSAREVAERLGISERWVRDHATRRNPRIPAVKLGSLLRFRWADVEQFVTAQMTDPSRRFRGNVGQGL